jgi:C4-dicarboxylate-specific signal transduction histidine kinase
MKHLRRLFNPPAWSIAVKLSVALLSVAIAPMGLASYYNLQQSLKEARSSEYRKLELLAASNAGRLDQLLVDIQNVAVQISTDRNIIDFLTRREDTPQQQETLRSSIQENIDNVFSSSPEYDAIYLLDKEGRCVVSTNRAFVGQNYNFREYFQQAISGRPYISGILVGQTTKRPGLHLSTPIRANSGEILGVAVVKIRAEKISAIVNSLQIDDRGHAFLVDQHGVIISHSDSSVLYRSLAPLPPQILQQVVADKRYGLTQIESLDIPELATAMVGAKETGHGSYTSEGDRMSQMVGFAPLEIQSWVLGVTKPEDQFVAPLNRLIWQNTRSVLAVGAIATLLALLLARSISRPICLLTRSARALEQGEFEPQTLAEVSRSPDDMGQLVRVFTNMAGEVQAREQKLKQQVKALHIEIDEAKKNRQVAELTGTEYFQELEQKVQKLRTRTATNGETETDYFQKLHKKAQAIKKRVPAVKQG